MPAMRRFPEGNGNTMATGFLVLSPCNHTGFLLGNEAATNSRLGQFSDLPGAMVWRVIRYS